MAVLPGPRRFHRSGIGLNADFVLAGGAAAAARLGFPLEVPAERKDVSTARLLYKEGRYVIELFPQ